MRLQTTESNKSIKSKSKTKNQSKKIVESLPYKIKDIALAKLGRDKIDISEKEIEDLNNSILRRERYNLIKEIQSNYNLQKFMSSKVPNYKIFASIYKLFEYNTLSPDEKTESFFNIVEHVTTNDNNIKLSERITIPSSSLRGFEQGKVGPKDGDDFIGGNYMTAINLTSTLPQILENSQSTDFIIFLDMANVWGVDYDSSLGDSSKIRSSIGIGVDYFTPIGPLNFSLSQVLSKADSDKTESFRFNLGTTF